MMMRTILLLVGVAVVVSGTFHFGKGHRGYYRRSYYRPVYRRFYPSQRLYGGYGWRPIIRPSRYYVRPQYFGGGGFSRGGGGFGGGFSGFGGGGGDSGSDEFGDSGEGGFGGGGFGRFGGGGGGYGGYRRSYGGGGHRRLSYGGRSFGRGGGGGGFGGGGGGFGGSGEGDDGGSGESVDKRSISSLNLGGFFPGGKQTLMGFLGTATTDGQTPERTRGNKWNIVNNFKSLVDSKGFFMPSFPSYGNKFDASYQPRYFSKYGQKMMMESSSNAVTEELMDEVETEDAGEVGDLNSESEINQDGDSDTQSHAEMEEKKEIDEGEDQLKETEAEKEEATVGIENADETNQTESSIDADAPPPPSEGNNADVSEGETREKRNNVKWNMISVIKQLIAGN